MDVSFSVERALVMHDVGHIWDIKSSCSDIGADQDGGLELR